MLGVGAPHGLEGAVGVEREGGVEVAEEVAAIDLMRRRRAEGASLRVIAEELAAAQIPTKRGGAWRACTVDAVLKRVERLEREEQRV